MTHATQPDRLQVLRKEHLSLKARVNQLQQRSSRTSAEQIEIAELKKRKLQMKDRMLVLRQREAATGIL